MAPTIGMHQGLRPLRQRLRGLDEHSVGELHVGTEPGRVRDDPAVMAVDHWREVRLPVPGLDLGDVREPFLVRGLGGEIAVDEISRRGRGLALVGTVTPTSWHVRDEIALGHDPADYLLRDEGSEHGLDLAVSVPALGRGERLRVITDGYGIPASPRRGLVGMTGVPVPGLQRGHSAFAVRLDPVVDRSDAHVEPFGGLLLLHAAQHQFDRLRSCLRWDDGFGHMASIPVIRRQPAFQALPGRIAQVLHHLGRCHRRGEIQVHRTLSFLGAEHMIILSFSLQENVRSPPPHLPSS